MTTTQHGVPPVVELRGVNKRFGGLAAVSGLDLVIPRGATYGILGPNGAGKTTTIRMLLRILEPDTGSIRLFGEAPSQRLLDRIGYLPEERGLYRRMRVRPLLSFFAELKGIPRRVSAPRIGAWLDRLGLSDRADARLQELSKGNQQKVQFITAMLHEPELLILDEPFSGLDVINQQVLKEIVRDLRNEGRTIIFCTHMIDQAERLCDHVCILARGEKVVDGSIQAVRGEQGHLQVAITLEEWSTAAVDLLAASPLVVRVREEGVELEVTLSPAGDAQELLRYMVAAGLRLRRFERVEPSLEQIFLDRVGQANAAGEARERQVAGV